MENDLASLLPGLLRRDPGAATNMMLRLAAEQDTRERPPPVRLFPGGPVFYLEGGGGQRKSGPATTMGGGGRLGVEMPIGEYVVGGGIEGEMVRGKVRAPDYRGRIREGGISGADAFVEMPNGSRLSGEYTARPRTEDPNKMNRSYMLRYGWGF